MWFITSATKGAERLRINNPKTDEPYVWRTGIVEVRGPSAEFNGRYVQGGFGDSDTVSAVRNLSCLANLNRLGIAFDPDDLETACASTYEAGDTSLPLRMRVDDVFRPTQGRLDGRTLGCSTPDGVDTCCSVCDHELSVRVAKYGVDATGTRRSPNMSSGLECDPTADRVVQCRGFRADVDRSTELLKYRYDWDGCFADWPVPRYDRIRATHPDDRPEEVEPPGVSCGDDSMCLSGDECIGMENGSACKTGDGCLEKRCIAQWFVECRVDPGTILGQAYCVDSRFQDSAAGACYETTAEFVGVGGAQIEGSRLAQCDLNMDRIYSAQECCQDSLGNEPACDPLFQAEVETLGLHDRDASVPDVAHCLCTNDADQPASCDTVVQASCAAPIGAETDPGGGSGVGQYALRSVTRQGGTRFDEELGGFDLRLAHFGGLQRALPERCAQAQGLIDRQNPDDSWLAHTNFVPSVDQDFDVSMCSGSTYEVVFAGPDDAEHIVSQTGDTLAGKQRYVFETSQFLVVPGTGFPGDALVVASCADFSLRFSNKYDLSADNIRKLAIWEIEQQGGDWVTVQRIAGGRDCDPEASAADVAMGATPCLLVDIEDFSVGQIRLRLDVETYGDLLQPGVRYRVAAPGLDDISELGNAEAYSEAFHDACGMPLITGDLPEAEYSYDFTIDQSC